MEQEYRVITLTQPWATLVALGAKRIETRSWATKYRGPLLIHAAAGLGPVGGAIGLHDLCWTEPFRSTLLAAAIKGVADFPRGAIVARCELRDCCKVYHHTHNGQPAAPLLISADTSRADPLPGEPELSFGDYTPGRYAWLLSDVQALPTPIPAKGQLGLWTWRGTLPA